MPRSPAIFLLLLVGCSVAVPALAGTDERATVRKGQPEQAVLNTLGEPVGTIALRDRKLLLYPRGEITLKQGKVAEVDLMSEEAFAEQQKRLAREREAWLEQKRRREVERIERGKSIRDAKKQSGAFAALPAKERLDYWREFRARYPEVDVSEEIARALESYQSEVEELETRERIAELETRVARAEREAAEAKREAREAKRDAERTGSSFRFEERTTPVRYGGHFYRPPTVTIISHGEDKNDDTEMEEESEKGRLYKWQSENASPVRLEKGSTAERASRILGTGD